MARTSTTPDASRASCLPAHSRRNFNECHKFIITKHCVIRTTKKYAAHPACRPGTRAASCYRHSPAQRPAQSFARLSRKRSSFSAARAAHIEHARGRRAISLNQRPFVVALITVCPPPEQANRSQQCCKGASYDVQPELPSSLPMLTGGVKTIHNHHSPILIIGSRMTVVSD